MKETNKEDLKILRITTVVVLILEIGLHHSQSVKAVMPILLLCTCLSEIVLYV